MSLAGKCVALAEGRQLEELAHMLEKEGALVLRCPLLSILDAPDEGSVVAWLQQLMAGQLDWVVLLTGEGLRRLLACAERHGWREQAIAALAKSRTVTRGPKPVRALKEVGLAPTLVATVPTTAGVISALHNEALKGQAVGVQLYSPNNPPLTDFLQQAGARVHAVLPYVYAPGSAVDHVVALITRMEQGQVDALVFTSSPQVDRLFEVAAERHGEPLLRAGLTKTKVAAVGPVVAANLEARGVAVAICPEQGFVMKNLVQLIKRAFAEP